jgi:hypothetical protein
MATTTVGQRDVSPDVAGALRTIKRSERTTAWIGTRAQLIQADLLGLDHQFPERTSTARWEVDGYRYTLSRKRPPERGRRWVDIDHWELCEYRLEEPKQSAASPAATTPTTTSDEGVRQEVWEQFRIADAFRRAVEVSPARWRVGDTAMLSADDEEWSFVDIVKPYGPHPVKGDGVRFGYGVRYQGDDEVFFAAPHLLVERDFSVRHLRLVRTVAAG